VNIIMVAATQDFIAETLAGSEPFRSLDATILSNLAHGTRVRHLEAGEIVVHRGDRPAGMYLVARGEVKLYLISNTGAERILRLARAGDTFCEESISGDMPQTLWVQTTAETVVLHVTERALQQAMASDTVLAQVLIRRMSSRICELIANMELCEQRNSAQRVAHYLVHNADRASDAIEVKLSSNKQTIASQLNMTPESFSRVLNRFTREGFILCRGRKAIRLTDLSGLQSLAA
jgi:CRP/FNR family transcriptional regulator, dissimilatory nitrate respiration regulator